ncbi:MAG: GTPase Era [Pseudomonadota bacterium]|nr:GTPase Era [Pseudomonadota bacterium]
MSDTKRSCFGYVALVGRPNAGKSTLFNSLLGQSLSVVTRKAQTTQSMIMGICSDQKGQYVLLDTPGVQQRFVKRRFQSLNKIANQAAFEADVAVFVTGGLTWKEDDDKALESLRAFDGPRFCVLNKWDQYADKPQKQREFVEKIQAKGFFDEIILCSAKVGLGVDVLHTQLLAALPQGEKQYDDDMLTEHSEGFILAEILRGQCLSFLHEEIPYHCITQVESIENHDQHVLVQALIWVPSSAKKTVIIGKGGKKLEAIGHAARLEMEAFLEKKVVLKTWVKVGQPELPKY